MEFLLYLLLLLLIQTKVMSGIESFFLWWKKDSTFTIHFAQEKAISKRGSQVSLMVSSIKRAENSSGEIFGDLAWEYQIDIEKKEGQGNAFGDHFYWS